MLFKRKKDKGQHYVLGENKEKFEIQNPLAETVIIDKSKIKFVFETDKDGFTFINYNNKRFQVEILDKRQNKFTVLVNGVSYVFSVETPTSLKRKKILDQLDGSTKTKIIPAPMPGKIVDILVQEGDVVNIGDPLIILEAMKMQNEILSDVAGKITKIHVKKDGLVMKDDFLVELI